MTFAILLAICKPYGVLWQSDLALFINTIAVSVAVEKKENKQKKITGNI